MLYGAVDMANYVSSVPVPGGGYPGGAITDQMCQGWLASGYSHAIVSSVWPGIADHQCEVCVRNGMTLDLYHWQYHDGRDLVQYLNNRKFLSDKHPVMANYLDCESDTFGKGASQIRAEIQQGIDVLDQFQDGPAGIYTAEWWWPEKTGNWDGMKDRRLMHAAYSADGSPKRSLEQAKSQFPGYPRPYGGWARPTMWQFEGSVMVAGGNVDVSVLEVLDAVPAPPDPHPTLPPILGWNVVSEGYFVVFKWGNEPRYRIGSTDGEHQGRVSRLRGDVWYWDRTDPATGHFYQSPEEGD